MLYQETAAWANLTLDVKVNLQETEHYTAYRQHLLPCQGICNMHSVNNTVCRKWKMTHGSSCIIEIGIV